VHQRWSLIGGVFWYHLYARKRQHPSVCTLPVVMLLSVCLFMFGSRRYTRSKAVRLRQWHPRPSFKKKREWLPTTWGPPSVSMLFSRFSSDCSFCTYRRWRPHVHSAGTVMEKGLALLTRGQYEQCGRCRVVLDPLLGPCFIRKWPLGIETHH
jgi:hypothetical protein